MTCHSEERSDEESQHSEISVLLCEEGDSFRYKEADLAPKKWMFLIN